MKNTLKIHLSEIHKFDDPEDPYIRTHVQFSNNTINDSDKFWDGSIHFMLKESDDNLQAIEKKALIKVKGCLANALEALNALV